MSVLAEDPSRIYIEVGPGRTMSSLVKAQGSITANQVINSLPHADEAGDDRLHFLGAVGRAWATGLSVPLERLWAGMGHGASRCRPIRFSTILLDCSRMRCRDCPCRHAQA